MNIAYVSIGGPLIVFVWIYLEVLSDRFEPVVLNDYHPYIMAAIVLLGIALVAYSFVKGQSFLKEARAATSLGDKLYTYKKKISLQHVTYGIVSGFITLGFYLTAYVPFEFLFFIMIFLVSIHQPNATRTVRDLGLKESEKDIITRGLDI